MPQPKNVFTIDSHAEQPEESGSAKSKYEQREAAIAALNTGQAEYAPAPVEMGEVDTKWVN